MSEIYKNQPAFPPEVTAVLGEIYRVTSPKQGATSQVWLVDCAAGQRVVKHASRPPFVDWLMREGLVLRALNAQAAIPFAVPTVYLDGATLLEKPLPYLVMSRLPGEQLSHVLTGETDPQRRMHLIEAWGATLRRLHDTPAPLALRHNVLWIDERLNTAAAYIEAGLELDAEEPVRLLEQMRASRPAPARQTLIHGDFMWDNVLVDGDQISGLVDWGGGAYGDPRYDLALAILPHEDGDLSADEVAAFYAAYGCEPLSDTEYQYFTNLYGFF